MYLSSPPRTWQVAGVDAILEMKMKQNMPFQASSGVCERVPSAQFVLVVFVLPPYARNPTSGSEQRRRISAVSPLPHGDSSTVFNIEANSACKCKNFEQRLSGRNFLGAVNKDRLSADRGPNFNRRQLPNQIAALSIHIAE
jgi:hypothetical protein